jgi:hypothetical protein
MATLAQQRYAEQLRDPRWQRRRLEILQRDNFACCVCGCTRLPLHVHHLEYGPTPWEVADKDLETLCESCHEVEHGRFPTVTILQRDGSDLELPTHRAREFALGLLRLCDEAEAEQKARA